MKHCDSSMGKGGTLFLVGAGLGVVVGVLSAHYLTEPARRLRYYASEALRTSASALEALRERLCEPEEDANESVANFI